MILFQTIGRISAKTNAIYHASRLGYLGSKNDLVNFLLFQILSLIHSIRIERIILFVDSVAPE